MTTKRISFLAKLLEQEKIVKQAQQVTTNEPEISEADADQQAKQIFQQIFDEEFEKMFGGLSK